jgi:hypothetical protein
MMTSGENRFSATTMRRMPVLAQSTSSQGTAGSTVAVDPNDITAGIIATGGSSSAPIAGGVDFQPVAVPILPELEPYMQARSPRFRCTAPGCGAPHGGLRGNYCPECWGKSQDPNGGVPPDPNAPDDEDYPEQGSNPANQGQYKVPPSSWATYFLLGGFLAWLLSPN